MRSDWRGVARGTAPKRSKSARGPPVCISSMAQQARPKSRYHCEVARPQLSRESTLVVKTVSGSELSNGFIQCLQNSRASGLDLFHPFQIALGPRINQTKEEDADKKNNLHERKQPLPGFNPAAKYRRHGKDEGDLDFEDNKNQGNKVKPDVEVNPSAHGGRLAVFVSLKFSHVQLRRPEQATDYQVSPDEA